MEIYRSNLLEKIKKYFNKKNKDYPTWNMYSGPKKFKIEKFRLIKRYRNKDFEGLRLTIDTKKDLDFAKKLIKIFKLKPGENNFLKILNLRNKVKIKLINYNKKIKLAYKIISNR